MIGRKNEVRLVPDAADGERAGENRVTKNLINAASKTQ